MNELKYLDVLPSNQGFKHNPQVPDFTIKLITH